MAAEAERAGLVLAPAEQVRTTTVRRARPVWGGLELSSVLLHLVTGVWRDRTPQSDDGYWDQAHPVVDHPGEVLTGALFALVVLSLLGWLVAGLWLADTGREPRHAP